MDRRTLEICWTVSSSPCRNHHWRDETTCADDAPFPRLCVETSPGVARCREADAVPCSPPGTESCDGVWILRCMPDGYLVHWAQCGGDNPICRDPTGLDPLCAFADSAPCDPATFGEGETGRTCDGNRILACHPTARITQVIGTCPEDRICVPSVAPGVPWCLASGTDADAEADADDADEPDSDADDPDDADAGVDADPIDGLDDEAVGDDAAEPDAESDRSEMDPPT